MRRSHSRLWKQHLQNQESQDCLSACLEAVDILTFGLLETEQIIQCAEGQNNQ